MEPFDRQLVARWHYGRFLAVCFSSLRDIGRRASRPRRSSRVSLKVEALSQARQRESRRRDLPRRDGRVHRSLTLRPADQEPAPQAQRQACPHSSHASQQCRSHSSWRKDIVCNQNYKSLLLFEFPPLSIEHDPNRRVLWWQECHRLQRTCCSLPNKDGFEAMEKPQDE